MTPSLLKRLCTGLLALTLTMACGAEEPGTQGAVSKSYDLYLLTGQSNMAARGKVDIESKQTHPRVFTLSKEGRWIPAVDPLHFNTDSARTLGARYAAAMLRLIGANKNN